jgi:hypothetical protein
MIGFGILLFAASGVSAQAADYRSPNVTEVGGWKVVRAANSCGMSRTYPAMASGGTASTDLMIVTQRRRQSTHVVLTNADWSATEGKAYTLRYDLGDFSYRVPAIGLQSEGVNGYEAEVSENFLYDFSRADDLTVSQDGATMGNLDLRGGYAAIVEFRECVAAMRGQETD